MLRNSIFKTISFLFFIVLFNSCDKEFNVVGVDLIGDNTFDIIKEEFPVVAHNQKLGPIQSNNMDINPLGIYANPSFGTTKASFTTQVSIATLSPTFDKETAQIKSVVLSIPYFYDSTKTVLNADGSSTYVLDSIYGPDKAKMKLSVYESGYYMRDLDPEDQLANPQKYYTNQFSDFDAVKIGSRLNSSTTTSENDEFFFDPAEIVVTKTVDGKETTTRSAPAMRLNLNAEFFKTKIFNAPEGSLSTNDKFKEYFRGLFFNIESIGAEPGNLAMINFKGGSITITYTEKVNNVDTEKTFVIQLTGNTVSFLDQSNTNVKYASATDPANINMVNGDSNLYLKGGEGSISVLKLFGEDKFGEDGVTGAPNGVPDQLDIMRKNKYLINQAELTFHLNSEAMGASYVPQRIFLYDFKNNQMLIDYSDGSTGANSKNNKYVFGGILTKESGDSYYKFRITNHIRNLVKYKDSTNVDIGLVVTENINKPAFYSSRYNTGYLPLNPLKAPMASVMNPLGAIVFGNNIPSDDKNYKNRAKFEIYYTKAN